MADSKTDNKDDWMNIRINKEIKAELKKMAKNDERTLTSLVQLIIKKAVSEHKEA